MLSEVLKYLDSGLSVIPVNVESKASTVAWKEFEKVKPTHEQAKEFWKNGAGCAVVAGTVSGNVEIIDLDSPLSDGSPISQAYAKLVKSWNLEPLFKRLLIESTQTPGRHHLAYRHPGKPCGNLKLASRPSTEEELKRDGKPVQCMIETRGEGGYAIIAPTPGYKIKQGSWLNVPEITADEREALLAAARYFNEMEASTERVEQKTEQGGDRPGDIYNQRASIDEILIPHGWVRSRVRPKQGEFWTRPGKENKYVSAAFDNDGRRKFKVFTSSTLLEPKRYSLFELYTALNHNGDFTKAAKAVSDSGYCILKPGQQPRALHNPRNWFNYDEIEEAEIDWLIEPYIPAGHVTLLLGDSGIGKSTATLAIASGLTNGIIAWNKTAVEPGRAILLSAEDPADSVVLPRLLQMGAKVSMIRAPQEFDEDGLSDPLVLDEYGCEDLLNEIKSFGAKLVVIDPLRAYFDGDNMNDQVQARRFMRRLTNICVQTGASIILVHHVTKNETAKGRYRAAGSQDFFDASRSALMAVGDPENKDVYALTHEKHNLSFRADAIGYMFTKEDGFSWTGHSELTSEMAAVTSAELVDPKSKKACTEWILEQLETEGVMHVSNLDEGIKQAGFSAKCARKAKEDIRSMVKYTRTSDSNGWWIGLKQGVNYE